MICYVGQQKGPSFYTPQSTQPTNAYLCPMQVLTYSVKTHKCIWNQSGSPKANRCSSNYNLFQHSSLCFLLEVQITDIFCSKPVQKLMVNSFTNKYFTQEYQKKHICNRSVFFKLDETKIPLFSRFCSIQYVHLDSLF